ncbi:hypothetical protein BKA62DRAFT_830917 [Auriculariales sp. MPI-PUGE-AT-0066]|nr:hypothetical protein BKA62DRAFT_830917 [Auriculariales sp. MPI-PUGE-AT-0066]
MWQGRLAGASNQGDAVLGTHLELTRGGAFRAARCMKKLFQRGRERDNGPPWVVEGGQSGSGQVQRVTSTLADDHWVNLASTVETQPAGVNSNTNRTDGSHISQPRNDLSELTRKIGYLAATAADDWALVLEVCERSAASEAYAREAATAIRREFKYAEPSAQMAAARLWAIMLRYGSEVFAAQTCTKTFLETVEEVCTSNRTTPVVRDRLLEVVAGAAYAHPSSSRDGFAATWKRIKHSNQPEEGIPFDDLDPMFQPQAPRRQRQPGTAPHNVPQPSHDRNLLPDGAVRQPGHLGSDVNGDPSRNRRMPTAEEKVMTLQLYEQCEVARENARLLSRAMADVQPLELSRSTMIKELYAKCMASQDFTVAQIQWATAQAEQSREMLEESLAIAASKGLVEPETQMLVETPEDLLLKAILVANQELTDVFEQYYKLERMLQSETRAAPSSINEARPDRTLEQHYSADGSSRLEPPSGGTGAGSSSRSASPAPAQTLQAPPSPSLQRSFASYAQPQQLQQQPTVTDPPGSEQAHDQLVQAQYAYHLLHRQWQQPHGPVEAGQQDREAHLLSNSMLMQPSSQQPVSEAPHGRIAASPRPLPTIPASVAEGFQSGLPVSGVRTLQDTALIHSSIDSGITQLQHSPGQPNQLRVLAQQPADTLQLLPPSHPDLIEPSSITAPAPVRGLTRVSVWTIDTFQSAPSNRTVVSPDWESVPLPSIADEEDAPIHSLQDATAPEPPTTPPITSPPPVSLLLSLEDLPLWKDQITEMARLLVCDEFLTRAGAPAEPVKVRLAPDYKNFALYRSTREHIERHRDASRRAIELVTSNLDPNLLAALRPIIEKDEHQAWELMEALDRRATYRREQVARSRMVDQLMDTRYEEGSDMRAHIMAVRAVLDPLETVEMSHGFRVMLLLSSLPRTPEWETFKDDLLSSTTDDAALTLDDVESALLRRTGLA